MEKTWLIKNAIIHKEIDKEFNKKKNVTKFSNKRERELIFRLQNLRIF